MHAVTSTTHCSGHGECYLSQCFCGAPFAGERCERTSKQPACSLRCDDCFRHLTHGRARVSLERWQRASWAEATWWGASKQRGNDDHAGAMAGQFQEFKALPHRLGHVLEIGCGPFTQLKTILGVRSKEWSVESVTLADLLDLLNLLDLLHLVDLLLLLLLLLLIHLLHLLHPLTLYSYTCYTSGLVCHACGRLELRVGCMEPFQTDPYTYYPYSTYYTYYTYYTYRTYSTYAT
jgi:hypothetical protein